MNKKFIALYKNNKKSSLIWYIVLRTLVIISMTLQFIHGNYSNVLLCFFTLILFTVPAFVGNKFKIDIPNTLEIIIYCFIFSAEILGDIQNFYGNIPYWDTILHTLNGFLCGAIGFSLIDILNNNEKFHINLTPFFASLVAFTFSMTIGVLWEFFEFGSDYYLNMDMQKDRIVNKVSSVYLNTENTNDPLIINDIKYTTIYSTDDLVETKIDGGFLDIGVIDTMKDLFVNFIGALVFSAFGFLYIKNRDHFRFIEQFLLTKTLKQKD